MAIKTRIQLANDELSNWLSSGSRTLSKGEVALAYTGDKVEVRVGNGTTYSNSKLLQLSASQVVGLQTELDKIHVPQVYEEKTDIIKVSDIIANSTTLSSVEFGGGDVLIAENTKGIKTAYHYDNEDGWIVCDGNVDASKVYFTNDTMKITYTLGRYKASAESPKDVTLSGWNLQSFLADAYAQTEQATVTTNPGASITINSYTSWNEVGTDYTVPTAYITFTDGAYSYEPKAAKISVDVGKLTIQRDDNAAQTSASNTTVLTGGNTLASRSDSLTGYYTSSTMSCTFSGTCYHTASPVQPKTNIGTDSTLSPIAEGSSSVASKTAIFTGYYPNFYGYLGQENFEADDITQSVISALSKQKPSGATMVNPTTSIDACTSTFSGLTKGQWFEFFYAIPYSNGVNAITGADNEKGLPFTMKYKKITMVFPHGISCDYLVSYIKNSSVASATKLTLKTGSKTV